MNQILLLITFLGGIFVYANSHIRSAKDVLGDLSQEEDAIIENNFESEDLKPKETAYKKELLLMGLSDKQAVKRFELKTKLIPLFFIMIALMLRLFAGSATFSGLLLTVLFSFAIGVMATSVIKKKYKENYQYQINFYLPLIMERLVMAVQAGQDILPAIGIILGIEKKEEKLDPICDLLAKVKRHSDAGLSFEKSLHQVAETVDSGALRHAFIHLALAHKEGGELIQPLRELSDSTQLFYQETIEEEIAKMPVKATMPLLLTFAGLIICFITSPIIQIIDVMQKSMPK